MSTLIDKYNIILHNIATTVAADYIYRETTTAETRIKELDDYMERLSEPLTAITYAEISTATMHDLKCCGFTRWENKTNLWGESLMLIPIVLINALPEDLMVHPITPGHSPVTLGECNKFHRYGFLTYGIYAK